MIGRDSCHEAAHVLSSQWMGAELLIARANDYGCDTGIDPRPGLGTPDDQERAKLASAIYSVAGQAGEFVLMGLPADDTRAATDLSQMRDIYERWPQCWGWAKDFDRFKTILCGVTERALLDELDTLKTIESLIRSHKSIHQGDISPLGRTSTWLAPGADWRPAFEELTIRANETIAHETKQLAAQREFARSHAEVEAQVARHQARVAAEPRPFHLPPRMFEKLAGW